MRRRDFISLIGSAAATWPVAAHAQQVRILGALMNGIANEPLLRASMAALTEKLRELGWIEGKNLHLEVRWNGGSAEQARAFASELTALKPAVILSSSTTNLLALSNATNSIPIVFVSVSDPVAQGFVPNLTKPGGNITGFSAFEFSVAGKWLELLREVAPKLEQVTMMVNPDTSPQSKYFMKAMESAAPSLKLRVDAAWVRTPGEIDSAITRVAGQPNGSMVIPTDSYTRPRNDRIAELALKSRVPTLSASGDFVNHGGLMFYGPVSRENMIEQSRSAASYIDRILHGANPGDLPIQGASKYALFINRKTATALGLEIPPKLLFTADKVIE